MRIDVINTEIVHSKQLAETPDILKTLFRGSKADLGIIEGIRAQGYPTLESFWGERAGVTNRGHLHGIDSGYQKLRRSSRVHQKGDCLPGVDASYLYEFPEITATSFTRIAIDSGVLANFSL